MECTHQKRRQTCSCRDMTETEMEDSDTQNSVMHSLPRIDHHLQCSQVDSLITLIATIQDTLSSLDPLNHTSQHSSDSTLMLRHMQRGSDRDSARGPCSTLMRPSLHLIKTIIWWSQRMSLEICLKTTDSMPPVKSLIPLLTDLIRTKMVESVTQNL